MQKLLLTILTILLILAFSDIQTSQAANWTSLNSGSDSNLYSLSCPTSSNCYALGTLGPGGTILATTNGGATWLVQPHPDGSLQTIACPTPTSCLAVGNVGLIEATTDGATWNAQNSGTNADLFGVACPTATICYAVGSDSNKNVVIIGTANGGSSWQTQLVGNNHALYAVTCPNASTCYGVGVAGSILATTNGGATWNIQNSGTTNSLSAVSCVAANLCYAVGNKGTIVKTSSGGAKWFGVNSGTPIYLRKIYCNGTNVCTAVGSNSNGKNGLVFNKSADGFWSQATTNSNGVFDVSCPTSTSKCFAVGFGGTILTGTQDTTAFVPTDTAAFNDPGFGNIWSRPDRPVSQIPNVGRGYTWGPLVGNALAVAQESYGGSTRVVQYFDKARMEVNDLNGNQADPYYVTTGLLVKELVTGNRQDGDNAFTPLEPSPVQIAGDPNDGDANAIAPTYASFRNVVTFFGNQNGLPNQNGSAIIRHMDKAGNVSNITPPEQRLLTGYDDATHHNVADVFVNYGNQAGQIWNGSGYVQGSVFYPNFVYVLGRPVTDPYWVEAIVAGQPRQVLVQLFERRVLTYTPTNPAGFKVEVGNVGAHYYKWRYILNK